MAKQATATTSSMKTASVKKPTTNDAVQATVMAIRERLMGYYKGTERLLPGDIVSLHTVRQQYSYHFERDHAQLADERLLLIDGLPLMNLTREPQVATFYATFDRSRSFRAVREGVERFMQKFLPGVEIAQSSEGDSTGWQGDRKLIMRIVQEQQGQSASRASRYDNLSRTLDSTLPYSHASNGDMVIYGQVQLGARIRDTLG